jgi:integrase
MSRDRIRVYVIKRPGRFWHFCWFDPATQSRRMKSSKCTRRRDAERAAIEFEQQLNGGSPKADGMMSFPDFIDLYASQHLAPLRSATRKRDVGILSRFNELQEPAFLAAINSKSISAYIEKIRGDANSKSEGNVSRHIQGIKTALNWARKQGLIESLPSFPKVVQSRLKSKGRPLTDAEFVAMLRATRQVVGGKPAKSWRRLLIGLWLSGLRINEAVMLSWDDPSAPLQVIEDDGVFLLRIDGDFEKGGQDRILPITPDFEKWLRKTPSEKRTGVVFPVEKLQDKDVRNSDHFSKVVSKIGKAAGIVVSTSGKFASAHDLRRTFGARWSQKVFPAVLQQLMRHSDIKTTMSFYVSLSAVDLAKTLRGK